MSNVRPDLVAVEVLVQEPELIVETRSVVMEVNWFELLPTSRMSISAYPEPPLFTDAEVMPPLELTVRLKVAPEPIPVAFVTDTPFEAE
jgi:hypothetical protein